MGAIIDELDDHEGYALGRLADGTLTAALTHGVEFTAYVAGCGCGWHSRHQHPPTEDGEEAAYQQWEREHAVVELARQATRRRQDLARVLAWLGGQAGRLEDPAAVAWTAPIGWSPPSSVTGSGKRPSGRPTGER
jgi:hypothetical protein